MLTVCNFFSNGTAQPSSNSSPPLSSSNNNSARNARRRRVEDRMAILFMGIVAINLG